jgi:hypothetical protein
MLSKAHRSQFSRALEVAGSTLGERSPSRFGPKRYRQRALENVTCRQSPHTLDLDLGVRNRQRSDSD